ncbi:MAG: hypothetical protein RL742_1534, partial [Bacteroidota bacterium]
VTRSEWYRIMSKNVEFAAGTRPPLPNRYKIIWNTIWKPIEYYLVQPARNFVWKALRQPLQAGVGGFERYMQGQIMQKWLFGLSITLICLLGYRVSTYTEENYAKPEVLIQQTQKPNPEEDPGYLLDQEPPPYKGGIRKQYPPVRKKPN